MPSDIHASIKDITHPKSGGRPANMHAVSAGGKNEPDFERMRDLSRARWPESDKVAL